MTHAIGVGLAAAGCALTAVWWLLAVAGQRPGGHEGATMRSPKPKAEMQAAGEDPMLARQIEIHREVSAEAREEERRRLELAEIEERTSAEMDAIFGPLQDSIDTLFDDLFAKAEKWAGLGTGWVYGFYVDAQRRAAEAEKFAREVVTRELVAVA